MSIREREIHKPASPEELVPQVKEIIRRSRNILGNQAVELSINSVQFQAVGCKECYWIGKDLEIVYRIFMLGVEPEGCFSVNSKEVLSGPLDHGLFVWGIRWQTSNSFVLYDIPRDPKLVTSSKVWHLNITDFELVQKIGDDLKWGHATKKGFFLDACKEADEDSKEKLASKILEG